MSLPGRLTQIEVSYLEEGHGVFGRSDGGLVTALMRLVNFQDMQSTSKSMLDEIRNIRRSLEDNFEQASDGYTRKMFRFSAVAEDELQELRDGIVAAEKDLREVQTFYGEGEEMGRSVQSQEFFGIFRTFTSSYKVGQFSKLSVREVAMGW
jgi:cytokinesis protein